MKPLALNVMMIGGGVVQIDVKDMIDNISHNASWLVAIDSVCVCSVFLLYRQQVQQLFEKYLQNEAPGRRLSRHDAIQLLMAEFSVNEIHAQMIFDHFDKDANGAMSLWEFQHLYNVVGPK